MTYYLRAEKADVVVAIVYGYRDPREGLDQTAMRLFELAARG